MGYEYQAVPIEPINEGDLELLVGQERPKRSFARKIIRIALTIALALALLHSFRSPTTMQSQDNDGSQRFEDYFASDDHGELVECYRKDEESSFRSGEPQPHHPHEPHPHEPHHPDQPMQFVTLPNFSLKADDIYFFTHNLRKHDNHHTTYGEIVFDVADSDSDEIVVSTEIEYRHHLIADVCKFKREDGSLGVGVMVCLRKSISRQNDKLMLSWIPRKHHKKPEEDVLSAGREGPEGPPPHHPHGPPPPPPGPPPPGHEHRRHPHHEHHRENNFVKLVVKFPASTDKPLKLKSLATRLPLYRHSLGALGDSVHFDSLDLKAANVPIQSESVTATNLDVRTINAKIDGSFNATNSLKIATQNAPIDVTVSLTTTKAKDSDEPAILELHTSNAKLQAVITLSASDDAAPGTFAVKTTTANAPLNVVFDSAPSDSTLKYRGATANAPADVTLHSSYEGTFDLSTAWFEASIEVQEGTEDPAGRERKRSVTVNKVSRGKLEGETYWGEKGDETPAGTVQISTSLAPISITV